MTFLLIISAIFLIYFIVDRGINIRLPHAGMQAGVDALKALKLDDSDVRRTAREFINKSDCENTIAMDDYYAKRLREMTSIFDTVGGVPLNFKVYKTKEINAFATADGSIRVFSGLMDIVTDDELMAIVGHEMGHIRNRDSVEVMRKVLLTSAARGALSMVGGGLGKITASQLGALGEKYLSTSFSRKQEHEADEFSFGFLVRNGYDPYAMGDVLTKIDKVSHGGGEEAKLIKALFSTHPDSAERAARMRRRADEHFGVTESGDAIVKR